MKKLLLPLMAALTLGLAPFLPEPHLVGKVRWVLGGGTDMTPLDYFDLVLHATPWLWLAGAITVAVIDRVRGRRSNDG